MTSREREVLEKLKTNFEEAIAIMNELLSREETIEKKKTKRDVVILKMNEIGISNKYKGFNYICDILVTENERTVIRMKSYERVAEKFNVTTKAVERNIRTCIENAHEKHNDAWKKIFSGSISPKTLEFLNNMEQIIMMEEFDSE